MLERDDDGSKSADQLGRTEAQAERLADAREWEELDREALSTQELLEIRDFLRESGQATP